MALALSAVLLIPAFTPLLAASTLTLGSTLAGWTTGRAILVVLRAYQQMPR